MAELIVIGSGTGIPSLKRSSPGIVILSDHSTILVDSGSGTLRKMLEAGITYSNMDLLLYTHIHPDHIADLVPILFASKYSDFPREKDLLITGGPGFNRHFENLKTIYGSWIEPKSYRLTIEETFQKTIRFRDIKLSYKPMAHISESVGYRIEFENGKSMAISGDTDYCGNIVDLASGVDLLALECSFPDGKKVEGHLTPSLAGRIGLESGCKKLLLIHFYPICDQYDILNQCRQIYHGEIILGEDLMRIKI